MERAVHVHTDRVDLHTHSLFSDGTLTPTQLVAEAAALGLAGLALTDHDTMDGVDEARAAATAAGMLLVPGIEITTSFRGLSVHLLGYFLDPAHERLRELSAWQRRERDVRAREMVRLLGADFSISWDAVAAHIPPGSTVGRPHIADALVRLGVYPDRSAAFAGALQSNGKYYVAHEALDTVAAIALIRAAGGLPVLAHPAAQRQRRPIPLDRLALLAERGLYGVELDHPEHVAAWVPPLRQAARTLGLVVTGASDYHGAGKPNRLGACTTDLAVVQQMARDANTPLP